MVFAFIAVVISSFILMLDLLFITWDTIDQSCRWRSYFGYLSIVAVIYSYLLQVISRFFFTIFSNKYRWLTSLKIHLYPWNAKTGHSIFRKCFLWNHISQKVRTYPESPWNFSSSCIFIFSFVLMCWKKQSSEMKTLSQPDSHGVDFATVLNSFFSFLWL
jgi:hypothetical protein